MLSVETPTKENRKVFGKYETGWGGKADETEKDGEGAVSSNPYHVWEATRLK